MYKFLLILICFVFTIIGCLCIYEYILNPEYYILLTIFADFGIVISSLLLLKDDNTEFYVFCWLSITLTNLLMVIYGIDLVVGYGNGYFFTYLLIVLNSFCVCYGVSSIHKKLKNM